MSWDQPHEGNMFEFLYKRRYQRDSTRYDHAYWFRFSAPHPRDFRHRRASIASANSRATLGNARPARHRPWHRCRRTCRARSDVVSMPPDYVCQFLIPCKENPTTAEVDQCLEVARAACTELIIGLGGGSSMDTAKGCNFILTNGGRMQDYWGVGKATKPMLPLIAVPTTAGTGSECQSFALISDEETHQKMACGDPKARRAWRSSIPRSPSRSRSAWRHAPASTPLHMPWKPRSPRSEPNYPGSTRARLSGSATNLDDVFQQPDNLEARAAMQLGAAYAGTAIENCMLGAARTSSTERHPSGPISLAVIHGRTPLHLGETYARCRRLASALAKAGHRCRRHRAVMLANTPEMIEAHFGVPMTGGVLNTLNTRLDADAIAFMLEHGGGEGARHRHRVLADDRAALAQLPVKPLVIDVVDALGPARRPPRVSASSTTKRSSAEGDPGFDWQPPADEWKAISLNYTSGTTGNPKGVVYHHRGAYLNALSNIIDWGMPRHAVYLWTLPMFHCNGWCFAWTMAANAGTNVCLRKVEAKAIFDAIREHKVTHYCGAPIVHLTLINAPAEMKHGHRRKGVRPRRGGGAARRR